MGVPLCVSAAFTIAFISCACMEITMAEFVGVDIPMFWEDARDYCRANYQDLATIHSAQDNADVAAACRTTQPAVWLGNIRPCMIGLNDIQSEGNWVWSDGSPYNGAYTNWITEPQQPNNERGGEDAGYMAICFEDCAGDYNHKWGDGNFGKTQDGQSPVPTTFVCECGAQCDSDATTDAVCDDSKCSSVGNDCCAPNSINEEATCSDGYTAVRNGQGCAGYDEGTYHCCQESVDAAPTSSCSIGSQSIPCVDLGILPLTGSPTVLQGDTNSDFSGASTYTYNGCFNHLSGGNTATNFLDAAAVVVASPEECLQHCSDQGMPLFGLTDPDIEGKAGTGHADCHCGSSMLTQETPGECAMCDEHQPPHESFHCGHSGWRLDVYTITTPARQDFDLSALISSQAPDSVCASCGGDANPSVLEGRFDVYSFTTTSNFAFEATSCSDHTNFDSNMALLREDGILIVQNDDSVDSCGHCQMGSGTASIRGAGMEVAELICPDGFIDRGTYFLIVGGAEQSTGQYEVTLTLSEGDEARPSEECTMSNIQSVLAPVTAACCTNGACPVGQPVPSICTCDCAQVFGPMFHRCRDALNSMIALLGSGDTNQYEHFERLCETDPQNCSTCEAVRDRLTLVSDELDDAHAQIADLQRQLQQYHPIDSNAVMCLSGWTRVGDDCFKYFAESPSWTDAESRCVALGGHLAKIQNADANANIKALAPSDAHPFIGLTDAEVEGTWVWTDGEEITETSYSNFASSEPNQGTNENCVILYFPDGTWADAPCEANQWSSGYICMMPPQSRGGH